MDQNCIFCRIVAGTIPAKELYRDDEVVAFQDINPQAPLHALVIPTKHLSTLNDADSVDQAVLGKLMLVAKQVANAAGYNDYKVQMNCGKGAGQVVFHIHLHVLAGGSFSKEVG
ncbi:MAG: histidine triad nucleotide-binding protein [Thiofilum sp.]|uniref:histidine triad nucleotide-binding protein n=1 Tax=Thiofilum sp. TaxID=2212733 RepID=UPI0025E4C14E|nr:histidine triad nucleotide-binding protein [Thiofilum sp.]MBK8453440.1 histidine triad nucleotide-binding protein [Thiofilum sp.]